jgi:hypothetical protein
MVYGKILNSMSKITEFKCDEKGILHFLKPSKFRQVVEMPHPDQRFTEQKYDLNENIKL